MERARSAGGAGHRGDVRSASAGAAAAGTRAEADHADPGAAAAAGADRNRCDAGYSLHAGVFPAVAARSLPRTFCAGRCRLLEVHEGDTFRFGHDAAAGIAELKTLGAELGFGVVSHGSLTVRGVTVSSSEVRRRIAAGELSMARALLGRPFSILSTAGARAGRWQEADHADDQSCAIPGVAATGRRLRDTGADWRGSGCTDFQCGDECRLCDPPSRARVSRSNRICSRVRLRWKLTEATPVEVCFLMRLREERRFPSPEALKLQIRHDVERARRYFRLVGPPPPPSPLLRSGD